MSEMEKVMKVGDRVDLLSCYDVAPTFGLVLDVAYDKEFRPLCALVQWHKGLEPERIYVSDLVHSNDQ